MRKDITVVAEPREERGKNINRRLRLTGTIPAVVYGTESDPVAVAVSPKEVNKILHSSTGHNTIFNLEVTGKETTPVMIIDWQHDPVRDTLMHIDLKRIDVNKRIRVKVPVHVAGEAKGVKQQGGILEVITREIEIECLPDDIPEHFDVNVAEMLIGGAARASELPMNASMKLISPPDTVLAHVVALRTSETATTDAAAAPAAAEPEVMKKGKKEEAAPADDKKKK
jgi:large subunit ribosomal protein L25